MSRHPVVKALTSEFRPALSGAATHRLRAFFRRVALRKLNQFFHLHTSKLTSLFAALCLLPILLFGVYGQTANSSGSDKILLPDKLGENWRAIGIARALSADQSSVLPDGDVYREYWLENLSSRIYTDGKNSVAIEVFRMQYDSGAYGLFTFNRARLPENRRESYSGRYLISLSSDTINSVPHQELMQLLKANLDSSIGELPPLPSHLPAENKISGSDVYLVGTAALAKTEGFSDLKDVVNFSGGTEIAIGKYRGGNGVFNLAIVEYHTPQLASDGYAQFQAYFNGLPEQDKTQRLLKRIGNYVVLTTAVQDMPSVEKTIAQIKYNPGVYWEGKKITDIPIAFRPPDPLVVAEASQTANMLIRTFYWIGVMLFGAIVLGIISGWIFFSWNRYRRRKLGLDNIFSDAGGTVRLNLDEYLLSPGDPTMVTKNDEKKI